MTMHEQHHKQTPVKASSTGKRLLEYGLLYKKTIIVALLFLIIAVGAEVIGPLIAKQMIDQHVTSINKAWHYVAEGTAEAVPYQDKWLVREDKLADQQ